MSSTSHDPLPDEQIELQVGERHFTTLTTTLTEGSSFFAALFSDRWAASASKPQSLFIDADPDLFTHILRYLRRGVLPIIYDKSHGFDHAFYRALQAEAAYFGIEPLYHWIKKEGYMQFVTFQYSVREIEGRHAYVGSLDATVDANTERTYHPSWGTEKVLQCPMGISAHNEDPNRCGHACTNARGSAGDKYITRKILRTQIVTKKAIFNDNVDITM
ncbi:hypothetical protein MMC09_003535 [Bachmanniomyces sp. S44760]|nr:hypothetical protein [Bachmanniomyces sp. S44760]